MANHRTILVLKPYMGINIQRLTKAGALYYFAKIGDKELRTRTRKDMHKTIRNLEKE